jgi:hypothetical protein
MNSIKYEFVKSSRMGITYKMTDPKNTTQMDIQVFCNQLTINGLTWKVFGDLLFFYRGNNICEDEDEEGEY